jgi:hypothetical protein
MCQRLRLLCCVIYSGEWGKHFSNGKLRPRTESWPAQPSM